MSSQKVDASSRTEVVRGLRSRKHADCKRTMAIALARAGLPIATHPHATPDRPAGAQTNDIDPDWKYRDRDYETIDS